MLIKKSLYLYYISFFLFNTFRLSIIFALLVRKLKR